MNANMQRDALGLLGDSPERDYARKLVLFNAFAAPELREAVSSLGLEPGMTVLDAGCGTGETLLWIQDAVSPSGLVVGIDLSAAHSIVARAAAKPPTAVIQASVSHPPLRASSFDLIWCANTIHHLRDPLAAALTLMSLLRPRGRIVFAQSSLLPELLFAWDSGLERRVTDAVRRYYQERYAISDDDLSRVRGIVGLARRAQLRNVTARTVMIERISPLAPADHDYLLEGIFRSTWGERLKPFLSPDDFMQLSELCDPRSRHFALRRPDFHYVQSLTFVTGHNAPSL
jgi:SAM-dependent methyltransferase